MLKMLWEDAKVMRQQQQDQLLVQFAESHLNAMIELSQRMTTLTERVNVPGEKIPAIPLPGNVETMLDSARELFAKICEALRICNRLKPGPVKARHNGRIMGALGKLGGMISKASKALAKNTQSEDEQIDVDDFVDRHYGNSKYDDLDKYDDVAQYAGRSHSNSEQDDEDEEQVSSMFKSTDNDSLSHLWDQLDSDLRDLDVSEFKINEMKKKYYSGTLPDKFYGADYDYATDTGIDYGWDQDDVLELIWKDLDTAHLEDEEFDVDSYADQYASNKYDDLDQYDDVAVHVGRKRRAPSAEDCDEDEEGCEKSCFNLLDTDSKRFFWSYLRHLIHLYGNPTPEQISSIRDQFFKGKLPSVFYGTSETNPMDQPIGHHIPFEDNDVKQLLSNLA